MRAYRTLPAACVAALLGFVPAHGLEKVARIAGDLDRPDADGWSRACTATIWYYNFCTGWIWTWADWEPGERVGVLYQVAQGCDVLALSASWHYAPVGNPAGYGYTGTMQVHPTGAGHCPAGTPLQSQSVLPVTGWNICHWTVMPPTGSEGFLLLWTAGQTPNAPVAWATDHPAAGATGPPACGSCYPVARTAHSFRYGTAAVPHCPGIPFDDGTSCAAELLWDIDGAFAPWTDPAVAVHEGHELRSWGSVKSLYR